MWSPSQSAKQVTTLLHGHRFPMSRPSIASYTHSCPWPNNGAKVLGVLTTSAARGLRETNLEAGGLSVYETDKRNRRQRSNRFEISFPVLYLIWFKAYKASHFLSISTTRTHQFSVFDSQHCSRASRLLGGGFRLLSGFCSVSLQIALQNEQNAFVEQQWTPKWKIQITWDYMMSVRLSRAKYKLVFPRNVPRPLWNFSFFCLTEIDVKLRQLTTNTTNCTKQFNLIETNFAQLISFRIIWVSGVITDTLTQPMSRPPRAPKIFPYSLVLILFRC